MQNQRHRVVIIGGGFGGLLCAGQFNSTDVDVTIIDRRNFHLFQPLLYQVATGGLSPANIAAPLRSILKKQQNVKTILGNVQEINPDQKQVHTDDGQCHPYDTLIVAAGSTHHYFGKDAEWQALAPGLKTIEDATEIRRRVLSAFENAERTNDEATRNIHLTFVVVGAGPTGVEMAGSIAELSHQTLKRDFRSINPADARVILVENGPRVLPVFSEKLSGKAEKSLADIGVETWLNCKVTDITEGSVSVEKAGHTEVILTKTVVWAAGVKASSLGQLLADKAGAKLDRVGRVFVNSYCQLDNRPEIFVIGDMAHHLGENGQPLPGVAPVAMQQGKYVAKLIARRLGGDTEYKPFQYWDKGNMATIGRSRAVAETKMFKMSGWLAWMAWLFIHVLYLARFENRILVMFQWFWNYITRNRTARLITNPK